MGKAGEESYNSEMIAEYAEAAELNRALAEEHMEAFSEIVAPGIKGGWVQLSLWSQLELDQL